MEISLYHVMVASVVMENFENWNFLQFGHQILVAVLVTLQDLVILWSRNATRNYMCQKVGGHGPLAPPSSAVPDQKQCDVASLVLIYLNITRLASIT